jgi:hypothetical protein
MKQLDLKILVIVSSGSQKGVYRLIQYMNNRILFLSFFLWLPFSEVGAQQQTDTVHLSDSVVRNYGYVLHAEATGIPLGSDHVFFAQKTNFLVSGYNQSEYWDGVFLFPRMVAGHRFRLQSLAIRRS